MRNMDKKASSNKKSSIKSLVSIVVIITLVGLWLTGIPTNIYKRYTLEQTYNRQLELQKNNDYASIYDEMVLPSDKFKVSKNEFLQNNRDTIYSQNYIINSIVINGDIGTIDRNATICFSAECTGSDKSETHLKKQYFYINGKWYLPLANNVYCTRSQEYPMPEEFRRAMSLVIQRFSESNLQAEVDMAKTFKSMQNCFDIQYAKSDATLGDAEGLFLFDKNSSAEDLQILVSPSYSYKDDILTAVLLTHEMVHAALHSLNTDKQMSCFENEAKAFTNQQAFVGRLNAEEKASLTSRYYTQSSQSVNEFFYSLQSIVKYQGATFEEKALNFVKGNAFYQKECSTNVSN